MHWIHPSLEVRQTATGKSVFSLEDIPRGTLLCVWGGRVYDRDALVHLSEILRSHSIQVETDAFLVPELPLHDADFFNHSCEANAGMSSSITLLAMRDIYGGEEVCFDYAMSDTAPYDEFDCSCGSLHCRQRITAEDWKLPTVQTQYRDFFSPYVQRLIAQL